MTLNMLTELRYLMWPILLMFGQHPYTMHAKTEGYGEGAQDRLSLGCSHVLINL